MTPSVKEFLDIWKQSQIASITQQRQEDSKISSGGFSLDITDPSQIIDPYQFASEFLSDTSTEGRARYLHMLEQGKYIQQMQMAAYQNWYNSPEQMAARERDAGLNPNLVGLDGAEAASAAAPDSSGVAQLPTSEQINSQRIANLTNILSSFGSLVSTGLTAFSSISLLPLQKEGLKSQNALTQAQTIASSIGNIENEKSLFQYGVSAKLAGAIADAVSAGTESEFDYDSFFGSDLSSVFNTYSSGSAYSQNLFADVLANREAIKRDAIDLARQRASGQIDFGKIAGSRYYSDDVVLTAGLLGPLMDAQFELEANMARYQESINDIKLKYAKGLDIEGLASSANAVAGAQGAEADYQSTYYGELDAEQMAAYDFMIKSNEAVKATLDKAINENLKTIYLANKMNVRGFAAAWTRLSGAGASWSEFLGMSAIMENLPKEWSNSLPPAVPSSVDDISSFGGVSPSDFWLDEAGVKRPKGFSFGD